MGATNFEQPVNRSKSMKEAYLTAVENAGYEHGHNAYNGTISTTSGFVDKTTAWKASGKELQNFIEDNMDGGGKWEKAWGVCTKEPTTGKPDGEYYFWGTAAE